jgi:acyl-coenzyme A synthetase/AMP-(fatty) acid ligase
MSAPPLARLMADGRPPGMAVAARAGTAITFDRFRGATAGLLPRLAGCRRAALVCRDTHAFAVGFFALLHAGAEIVLPPNAQPGTRAAFAEGCDRLVDDSLLDVPAVAGARFDPIDADAARVTFFTSGSTGAPKSVTKTLGMLDREVAAFDQVWGGQLGPVLATVSHQHLYGLTFRLLWPIRAGRVFAAETHEVWETVLPSLTRDATLISSPSHLSRMTGIGPVPAQRRPGLVFSAGAPLAAAAGAEARAILGCPVTEIFGSTETGAMAARQQTRGGEPWTPFPGNEIRLDAAGLVSVRSPYVAGWTATADIATETPDGFHFHGRSDQVVKIEGQRISLPEIETALIRLDWVQDAAVTPLPGPAGHRKGPDAAGKQSFGVHLGAAVVLTSSGEAERTARGTFRLGRELRRALAGTLEPAALPRRWRFVPAIPRRAMGKRDDASLRALFGIEPC